MFELHNCIQGLTAGMRVDAIQHERDAIGKRRKLDDDAEGNSFLRSLLNSEKLCAQLRGSVIKNTGQVCSFWPASF